jgi:hypothetical protein
MARGCHCQRETETLQEKGIPGVQERLAHTEAGNARDGIQARRNQSTRPAPAAPRDLFAVCGLVGNERSREVQTLHAVLHQKPDQECAPAFLWSDADEGHPKVVSPASERRPVAVPIPPLNERPIIGVNANLLCHPIFGIDCRIR